MLILKLILEIGGFVLKPSRIICERKITSPRSESNHLWRSSHSKNSDSVQYIQRKWHWGKDLQEQAPGKPKMILLMKKNLKRPVPKAAEDFWVTNFRVPERGVRGDWWISLKLSRRNMEHNLKTTMPWGQGWWDYEMSNGANCELWCRGLCVMQVNGFCLSFRIESCQAR